MPFAPPDEGSEGMREWPLEFMVIDVVGSVGEVYRDDEGSARAAVSSH